MVDLEKGVNIDERGHNLSHEAATAKMWTVYISEADKYDKALVASWRSDMNGMLIFAGLFSAILTAFVIESYKNLSPDSGEATVALLGQISDQLAGKAGNGTLAVMPASPFVPDTTALICNALWFISLGLSLSSALIATLLEQWARDFLHRADLRSAPVIRARIFSYLYYGLKRFNMHTVVEVIPLLLHASLLFFFAGLILFLLPVNDIIMGISAALFGLVVVAYSVLTFLPLAYLDCPYRTPLSGSCWRLLQTLRPYLKKRRFTSVTSTNPPSSYHSDTVVEAMVRRATEVSEQRAIRDQRALIWTVKSLTDEIELEPFVESIPDALWGPNGRRRVYDQHILTLANDPEVYLVTRIEDLLRSCDSGLLSAEIKERRQITCLKALWAIASLAEPTERTRFLFDLSVVHRLTDPSVSDAVHDHALSVYALIQWHSCCAINSVLREEDFHLDHIPDPILRMILRLDHLDQKIPLDSSSMAWVAPARAWVRNNPMQLQQAASRLPCCILIEYFTKTPALKQLPYRFLDTHTILRCSKLPNSEFVLDSLENLLRELASTLKPRHTEPGWCPVDEVFRLAGLIWRPVANNFRPAPTGMADYIHWRQGDNDILDLTLASWDRPRLFIALELAQHRHPSVYLDALWILSKGDFASVPPYVYARIISTINDYVPPSSPLQCTAGPLVAMMKHRWLNHIERATVTMTWGKTIALLNHPIMITSRDHAVELPAVTLSVELEDKRVSENDIVWDVFQSRKAEAQLCLFTDLLDSCCVRRLPKRAAETTKRLPILPKGLHYPNIHESHQLCFANSLRTITQLARDPVTGADHLQLLSAIVDRRIDDINEWLTSPLARKTLTECFAEYATTLRSLSDSPTQDVLDLISRLQQVGSRLERATLTTSSLIFRGGYRGQMELLKKEVEALRKAKPAQDKAKKENLHAQYLKILASESERKKYRPEMLQLIERQVKEHNENAAREMLEKEKALREREETLPQSAVDNGGTSHAD